MCLPFLNTLCYCLYVQYWLYPIVSGWFICKTFTVHCKHSLCIWKSNDPLVFTDSYFLFPIYQQVSASVPGNCDLSVISNPVARNRSVTSSLHFILSTIWHFYSSSPVFFRAPLLLLRLWLKANEAANMWKERNLLALSSCSVWLSAWLLSSLAGQQYTERWIKRHSEPRTGDMMVLFTDHLPPMLSLSFFSLSGLFLPLLFFLGYGVRSDPPAGG